MWMMLMLMVPGTWNRGGVIGRVCQFVEFVANEWFAVWLPLMVWLLLSPALRMCSASAPDAKRAAARAWDELFASDSVTHRSRWRNISLGGIGTFQGMNKALYRAVSRRGRVLSVRLNVTVAGRLQLEWSTHVVVIDGWKGLENRYKLILVLVCRLLQWNLVNSWLSHLIELHSEWCAMRSCDGDKNVLTGNSTKTSLEDGLEYDETTGFVFACHWMMVMMIIWFLCQGSECMQDESLMQGCERRRRIVGPNRVQNFCEILWWFPQISILQQHWIRVANWRLHLFSCFFRWLRLFRANLSLSSSSYYPLE